MLIGYARVSTLEQSLDLQTDALKHAGCEKLYSDMLSGAKANRPGLEECLKYARAGDTIVVWKLDRLGRNLKHLIETVQELEERGVGFKSLQENIDTTTPGGKLIFHVFGALSEFERDLIRERTLAGMAAARARGRVGGRRPKLDAKKREIALALHRDKGVSISEICRTLGVSRTTFYRSLPGRKSRLKSSANVAQSTPDKEIAPPSPSSDVNSPFVAAVTTPSMAQPRSESPVTMAARRILALGSTEQGRWSLEFQEARRDLGDLLPTCSSGTELVNWARCEVERVDKVR